ncbi:hypothetical protein H0H87_009647 [Tephrocybe sp. NHM501043]|nr:hypothetical protein H0H87_009647 [Tephrocybe sp. NHM501043]
MEDNPMSNSADSPVSAPCSAPPEESTENTTAKLFIDALSEAVQLQLQLQDIHAEGRIEDWGKAQSLTSQIQRCARTLAATYGACETPYALCKAHDARIAYEQRLAEWMGQAREAAAAHVRSFAMGCVGVACRVYELEKRLGEYTDVRGVARARARARYAVDSEAAAPPSVDEELDELTEDYQQLSLQMSSYSSTRTGDLSRLSTLSSTLSSSLSTITSRLSSLSLPPRPTSPVSHCSYPNPLLSLLISDSTTHMVRSALRETVGMMELWAALQVQILSEELVTEVREALRPCLGLVDVLVPPPGRAVECPVCSPATRVSGSRRMCPIELPTFCYIDDEGRTIQSGPGIH